jgi:hypothetical protein
MFDADGVCVCVWARQECLETRFARPLMFWKSVRDVCSDVDADVVRRRQECRERQIWAVINVS